MPDIKDTTRAQTKFLRAYRTHLEGPPPELWPSPAIFRKWLRAYGFRRALHKIIETLRFQADINLATVAACSSVSLGNSFAEKDHQKIRATADILRLSHNRQRFQPRFQLKDLAAIFSYLRAFDPKTPIGIALHMYKQTYPTAFDADDDLFDLSPEELDQLQKDHPVPDEEKKRCVLRHR